MKQKPFTKILTSDFPMGDYYIYAGMDGSKKVHPSNEMTIWWNDNYTASNAEQRTWISDIQSQVATIPFVTISLPFVESTTRPSGVHLEIKVNNNLGNATGIDANNYIIGGTAAYPSSSQRTFKVEVYQAMSDWQDSGGNPPFFDASGNINTTGKDVIAVSYLFKPKTYF